MSDVHKDKSNQRKGKVSPGWHKSPRNAETARLLKTARQDRANARFWS